MQGSMEGMRMPDEVSQRITWPGDMWIRGYHVELEDAEGRPIAGRLLHHFGMLDFDRRELAYPVVSHLFGGGEETGNITLPTTVGVPIAAGDHLAFYFMWHNETGRELDGVYIRARLAWIPRSQLPRPTLAYPFWVDVNFHPRGDDSFAAPPGGSTRVYAFTLPLSGHLLAAGGHLHEHGLSLRIEDAETGDVVVRVVSHRAPDGTVVGVSRRLFGLFGEGPHLLAQHRYLLVVSYENPTSDSLPAVMGVFGGLFVPDHPDQWPRLVRSDPMYLADLQGWENGMPAGADLR
jgi:hypothetical protein